MYDEKIDQGRIKEIEKTENELSKMIDELTGSEFDMKGLQDFKSLFGGE